jgi:imidazolonepropionase-like amidohydrolase
MAGPIVDGADPIWPPLSMAVSSTSQIPRYVKQLKRAGVDVVKGYVGLSERQLAALVNAARGESLRVFVDAGSRNGTAVVAATGIAAFAHLGTTPLTDETVAMMRDRKIGSMTTLAVYESFSRRRLADQAFLRQPLLADTMPPQFVSELTAFATRPLTDPARSAAQAALGRLQTAMANAKRLSDVGVLLAAGTDSPYPGDYYGEGLQRELELLVEVGIPPLQVITIATRNAARLVGAESEWGTVEPGKAADLLLVRGDPSKQIRDTRNIVMVIQRGRVVDRAALRFDPRRDRAYHPASFFPH